MNVRKGICVAETPQYNISCSLHSTNGVGCKFRLDDVGVGAGSWFFLDLISPVRLVGPFGRFFGFLSKAIFFIAVSHNCARIRDRNRIAQTRETCAGESNVVVQPLL